MKDAFPAPPVSPPPGPGDKCLQCRACTECDEVQCPFRAQGDPHDCAMEKCTYCMDFIKRQRMYMNNVG